MSKQSVVATLLMSTMSIIGVGCYNDFDAPVADESTDLTTNITTEELSRILSADGYVDVNQDIRVRGNVTAHDESGNFYKTFIIESGGYGVEIMEGLSDSFVRHELGYEMVIQLNGLRLTRSYGIVQIGVATSEGSYYDVDYMGHELLVDQYVTNTGYISLVEPREFTLAELSADSELATSLCGSLIRVVGLRYYSTDDDDDGLWCGTKCFIDATDPLVGDEAEASIWSYVNEYANFSGQSVPTTYGSITGILMGDDIEGGEGLEMVIKPRDIDDLNF